ncbi:hypothetical protein E2C01_055685 [Portunus trituberculatus]|uniref:Uncharacterized protein n=1 Tax=Portunus trituberculatus TaxID=210409 RepID=A0A5B7GNE0_PORTR|nr:hypothetical protein [Portunus trituberculatus]
MLQHSGTARERGTIMN